MNFGAPNWLWALAFLPLLVLLYARAERRSAIKLREFMRERYGKARRSKLIVKNVPPRSPAQKVNGTLRSNLKETS